MLNIHVPNNVPSCVVFFALLVYNYNIGMIFSEQTVRNILILNSKYNLR